MEMMKKELDQGKELEGRVVIVTAWGCLERHRAVGSFSWVVWLMFVSSPSWIAEQNRTDRFYIAALSQLPPNMGACDYTSWEVRQLPWGNEETERERDHSERLCWEWICAWRGSGGSSWLAVTLNYLPGYLWVAILCLCMMADGRVTRQASAIVPRLYIEWRWHSHLA